MVEVFYNRDFADLFFDDTTEMSQDERRIMQNAEKIKFKDGHLEIPQALAWNDWMKKKLMKDPQLRKDYEVFMRELVAIGYALKVPLNQA